MKYTVVDVGASRGTFSKFVAKLSNEILVVAVEPQIEVAQEIETLENLLVEVVAVGIPSSSDERRDFHIMANSELSSFLDVNSELDQQLWLNHVDSLIELRTVSVPVVSLQSLMEKYNFSKIDFLKIDTQGSDLEVLKSAGNRIGDICSVVLEFPYRLDSALYSGEVEVVRAISQLSELGFSPVRLVPNGAGECNLFLINNTYSIDAYFTLEKVMRLRKAPTLKLEELSGIQLALNTLKIRTKGLVREILNRIFPEWLH